MGGEAGTPLWAQILGLLLLAPPLVWAGYKFVYDQEREPYVGIELRNRVLICSAIFAVIWVIYAFVPSYVFELEHANEVDYTTAAITFFIMLGLGGLASAAIFELEYTNGLIHAGLYFISIVLLAMVSGVTLAGKPSKTDRLLLTSVIETSLMESPLDSVGCQRSSDVARS